MVQTMNQGSENLRSSVLLIDIYRHNLILGASGVGGKRDFLMDTCLKLIKLNQRRKQTLRQEMNFYRY